jgi:hypothetical protein
MASSTEMKGIVICAVLSVVSFVMLVVAASSRTSRGLTETSTVSVPE